MLLTVYNNELVIGAWEWGRGGEEGVFTIDVKAEQSDDSADLSSANVIFLQQPHSFYI